MQPIDDIAARCRDAGVMFTATPSRRSAKSRSRSSDVACHLLTISGHKIGAPKGIGALVVRDRKTVEAIIHGGGQQFGMRPGTENVAGAVGLGRAAELAVAEQSRRPPGSRALRDALRRGSARRCPTCGATARGPRAPACPRTSRIPGTDSEAMLMHLDLAGIAAPPARPAPPAPSSRRMC